MAEPIRWQEAWWYQQPDGTWLRFNDQTQTWEAQPSQPIYVAAPGMSTGAKVAIAAVIAFVVLMIVAILAAIAIPVFLRQRERAWEGQIQTALKNAAVAEESYRTVNPSYTPNVGDLSNEGMPAAPAVDIDIRSANTDGYCIEATHRDVPNEVWNYDSDIGEPLEGPCFQYRTISGHS